MHVSFHSKADYLKEISSAQGVVVRVSAETLEINEGVKHVFVVSGFHDDKYAYEARLPCGELFAGGPQDAQETMLKTIEEIRQVCREQGLDCRGGKYQWPQ